MKPETQNPAIYILVVYGTDKETTTPENMAKLSGQHFHSPDAMVEAVDKVLGKYDEIGWNIYHAEYYRERWNKSIATELIPAGARAYIAFMTAMDTIWSKS